MRRSGREPARALPFLGSPARAIPSLLLLVLAACAGRGGPEFPDPGWERGGTPDLSDARLLLFPLQETTGSVPADLDGELAWALRSRGPGLDLRDAGDLEGTSIGAGPLGADPANLPIGSFRAGEVRRVGDPLFGELYRLATFVEADLALLPLGAGWVETGEEGRAIALHAALLVPRTGRVLWQGIVQGAAGEPDSPAPAVSVAEALAARLLP